jgi:hypothetical protein
MTPFIKIPRGSRMKKKKKKRKGALFYFISFTRLSLLKSCPWAMHMGGCLLVM